MFVRSACLAAGLLLVASTAQAEPPELVDLFRSFCLDRFPDRDVTANAPGAMAAMPQGMVDMFLHDDPGRGWLVAVGDTRYALTVEDAPYEACAIRHIYHAPPAVDDSWPATLDAWAARDRRGSLGPRQTFTKTIEGVPVTAWVQDLPASADRRREVFMVFTSANPDGTTELRLVRQLADPPSGD